MKNDSPANADVGRSLQTTVRDLISLLTLPNLWSALGHDVANVARSSTEALEGVLSLDLVYFQCSLFPREPATELLRVQGADLPLDEPWREVLRTVMASPNRVCASVVTPMGSLRMSCVDIANGALSASLCVGARRCGFPSTTDALYLRACANLLLSGLQTSRFVLESERSNRAKDEFLAMLGHELRNPLAPIATALQLMKLKGEDSCTQEREIIERQVAHMTTLVDDLLDVSRVARGDVELNLEPISMQSLIGKALETVNPLLEEKQHHVTVAMPVSAALLVNADPVRLTQVLANVIHNAAKYTEPHGVIDITVAVDANQATVTIRDNGCGIAPELLPQVFDLFRQGQTTFDRSAGGLGIGLALAKNLISLHGGDIGASSEGAGRGSEFKIRLPLATADTLRAPPEAVPATVDPAANHARVLVVDDNKDAADLLAFSLEILGYAVARAHDAPSGLELARAFRPTVAILDLGLPGMDGYELAERIRGTVVPHPRFIALTGYGQEGDRMRSMQRGFFAHLTKPAELKIIQAAIQEVSRVG